MIPIRDLNPTRSATPITWSIIIAAAAVFFVVQPGSEPASLDFLYERATIPCEIVSGEPLTIGEIRTGRCDGGDATPQPTPGKHVYLSLLTSIFLHGGIVHLLGNLWILWIFGNNVEEDLGWFGFAAFYLVTGLAASIGHVALHPGDTIPVVGASGAIAGVMGAYLVLHPGAWVVSIVPPLFFLPFPVPAAVYLGVWLTLQFALADQITSVAWEAHVFGFAAGFAIALVLRANGSIRRRRARLDQPIR